jgi:MFS transporter, DHA1 family, inner membrane transport protein
MEDGSETSFGLIAALWVAGLCAAAQFAKIGVIFPELLQHYPDAGAAGGFLVSLLSFLGVVLGLVAGILVAKFGYRKLLLGALLLGAAISAYQSALPSFTLMLVSRLLEGASHLVIVVAAPTLIAQVSSVRHRGAAMTLWGTFFGVAFALVAWLGLPLVKAHGLASLFIVHAIAMLAVAVLLFAMLPHDKPGNTTALAFSDIIKRHAQTYTSAFVSAPAMGWLFYTLSFVSLLTLLPNHVAPEQRGFVVGAMPLASIISSMTIGVFLLRYLTAIQVVITGFVASMLCSVFLWLAPGSVIGCIALFGALGLVQGASFAAVPELNSENQTRAYANGAMAQMGNLGNLSGTPVLLLMLSAMGFNGLILFALLCYGFGIAVHLLMAKRRR